MEVVYVATALTENCVFLVCFVVLVGEEKFQRGVGAILKKLPSELRKVPKSRELKKKK